ncbi:ribonuclease T [Nitratireductor sp. XY-223]|uniref:ribonuclease T2 family protein n=1 Tax=Nitratireductor sp. XY-223 TaxID=2561926 RepID=UPI001FEFABDD|nr:ribonuclease T [Nitratireductor sp. XY-223]
MCIRVLALAGMLVLCGCDQPTEASPSGASGFDFYVLSLSWSPSYCEAEGERANREQCNSARRYEFIVHGLWPQFENGYPEYCGADIERTSRDIEDRLLDIMPSRGLIRHQWKKHGSCSGLPQAEYFDTLRAAHERIAIPSLAMEPGQYRTVSPAEIERAFLQSNPGLAEDHVAVTCDRRRLREVRICLTTDLKYRSCPEVDRRACQRPSIVLPPARNR